jgi:hypothetical protein
VLLQGGDCMNSTGVSAESLKSSPSAKGAAAERITGMGKSGMAMGLAVAVIAGLVA